MQNVIDFLLDHAGDSIQYRLRRDILNAPPQSDEMGNLRDRILRKPRVMKILNAQQPDGWIGDCLHGSPPSGLDSNVWFLLNFGLDPGHPVFERAVHALLHPMENEPYTRTFPGGPALDADGRGGDQAVLAKILANLGREDEEPVTREIARSLGHFRGALSYTYVDDFSVTTRSGSRRYYKPGALFPGANHIELLSAAKGWRTPENLALVKKSFSHCLHIMKGETQPIFFKSKTHFVGPFNFNWLRFPFSIDQVQADSYALVWWLRMLHNIAGIGFVKEVPELDVEYACLAELLDSEDLYRKQTEQSLQRFRQIWSLEEQWKNEGQIKSDLYFLAFFILHRAGYR